MISKSEIQSAPQSRLLEIRNELIREKMKMDKFFSKFLDQYELKEDNVNTAEWNTYKAMINNYESLNGLINTTEFYIKKNGRLSRI